jgi:putative hydrolase of the HAD superfamily
MLSSEPLRAILFDVGGPLVDERPDYQHDFEIIRSLLSEKIGREIPADEIGHALDKAIASWAPSYFKSIIWQYLKPDRELVNEVRNESLKRFVERRRKLVLMDGVEELIPRLASRFKLAIAANQPPEMREKLEDTGLMKYFGSYVLSGELGLQKPDSRFFLEICSRIDEKPVNCCMVGDRLDNDIYPANVLGMRTVLIHIGPHAVQEPRIPEDVPDAIITHMSDLEKIIDQWSGVKE